MDEAPAETQDADDGAAEMSEKKEKKEKKEKRKRKKSEMGEGDGSSNAEGGGASEDGKILLKGKERRKEFNRVRRYAFARQSIMALIIC